MDLHRHLDGSVRLETILDLGCQHNLPLPAWDLEQLRPYVQIVDSDAGSETLPGVMAFIAKFEWMVGVLADYDACRRVAYENVEDAKKEGMDYVELRFSPWFMAEPHGLDPSGVVEAVADGVEAGARDSGLRVKLIGILSRTYGVEVARQELDALLDHRDHFVALDLAGDEANWPGELFVEHFRRGMPAGKSLYTPANRPGQRAFGRRFTAWARPASATVSPQSKIPPCLSIWPSIRSVSSHA
jgi:adenosine deaminase